MDRRRVEAFGVLGIPADSDRDAVVHAYRSLARATHPDVSDDPDAADRFATVAAAYQLVSKDPRTTSMIPVRIHEAAPGDDGMGAGICPGRGRVGLGWAGASQLGHVDVDDSGRASR